MHFSASVRVEETRVNAFKYNECRYCSHPPSDNTFRIYYVSTNPVIFKSICIMSLIHSLKKKHVKGRRAGFCAEYGANIKQFIWHTRINAPDWLINERQIKCISRLCMHVCIIIREYARVILIASLQIYAVCANINDYNRQICDMEQYPAKYQFRCNAVSWKSLISACALPTHAKHSKIILIFTEEISREECIFGNNIIHVSLCA